MSLEREKGDTEMVAVSVGKDVGVPANCRELGIPGSPRSLCMNEVFLKQCFDDSYFSSECRIVNMVCILGCKFCS